MGEGMVPTMTRSGWIAVAGVSLTLMAGAGLLGLGYGCRASAEDGRPGVQQEADLSGAASGRSMWRTSVVASTGKPNQVVYLMSPSIGSATGPISVEVYDEDGALRSWSQVESLEHVGSEARAYEVQTLHDGTALIRFGDGQHGARPPAGERGIRVRHVSDAGQTTTLQIETISFARGVTAYCARGSVWDEPAESLRQHAAQRVFEVVTLRRVQKDDTEYRLYEVPGSALHAFLTEPGAWMARGETVVSVGPGE